MQVTGTNDPGASYDYFEYDVSRVSGGAGTLVRGAAIVDYGQSGDGFMEISGDGTNAPWIRVATHDGSPWDEAHVTPHAVMGNLNGILGLSSDEWGIAAGEDLDVTTGHYIIASDQRIIIDMDGATDAIILDADGDTTISSPTDDQIDFEVGGFDHVRFVVNQAQVFVYDSETSDISNAIRLDHNSSGTVVEDFGTAIKFRLQRGGTTDVDAGTVGVKWGIIGDNVGDGAFFVTLWQEEDGEHECVVVTAPFNVSPTAGNSRGEASVDLQSARSAATQVASGAFSFVAGGRYNTASQSTTFVSGYTGTASHSYAHVMSASPEATASWGNNTFTVRCHGGARFYSATGVGTGVQLSSGGTSWASISLRKTKNDFAVVDGDLLLETLARVPVQSWNLKSQPAGIRHLGPTSDDFNAAFKYLFEDYVDARYIEQGDMIGVNMRAIQRLYERVVALEKGVE